MGSEGKNVGPSGGDREKMIGGQENSTNGSEKNTIVTHSDSPC